MADAVAMTAPPDETSTISALPSGAMPCAAANPSSVVATVDSSGASKANAPIPTTRAVTGGSADAAPATNGRIFNVEPGASPNSDAILALTISGGSPRDAIDGSGAPLTSVKTPPAPLSVVP